MTTHTTILDAQVDTDSPITQPLMEALRDNPIASFEGAAGAPRLEDAALDTTATTAGETWVQARVALSSVGDIGTYALLQLQSGTGSAGTTHLGSTLQYAAANGNASGTPSGTWRCMGVATGGTDAAAVTLFLRIS